MRPRTRLTFRVSLILSLIVLLAGVNAILAVRSAHSRDQSRTRGLAMRAASDALGKFSHGTVDQETAERGFLITGDPEYLRPYDAGGADIKAAQPALLKVAQTSSAIASRLETLNLDVSNWQTQAAQPEIKTRRTQGAQAAAAVVATGNGKALFQKVRDDVSSLETVISTETDKVRTQVQNTYDSFLTLVFISLGAVALVSLLLAYLLSRWLTQPVERLAKSVAEVRSGNLDRPVEASGPAEMVQIANAVEEMRARLVEELAEVEAKTAELAAMNDELESFSYSVSHDLRAPLRSIDGFSLALIEDAGPELDDVSKGHLERIRAASQRMALLIDDLLQLSRVTRTPPNRVDVNVTQLALQSAERLRAADPDRQVAVIIQPRLRAYADSALVSILLDNLLGNAWKFTARTPNARIEVSGDGGKPFTTFTVSDNGAGFDQAYADKLFVPFQRLHNERDFPGTGIGLATIARIVQRHGGQVSATGVPDKGATITFSLPTGRGPERDQFRPPVAPAAAPTAPLGTEPNGTGPTRQEAAERQHARR